MVILNYIFLIFYLLSLLVMVMSLLLLLLSSSLSELLNPKGRPVKANQQAWRYFNPGSRVALRRMLSHWK